MSHSVSDKGKISSNDQEEPNPDILTGSCFIDARLPIFGSPCSDIQFDAYFFFLYIPGDARVKGVLPHPPDLFDLM